MAFTLVAGYSWTDGEVVTAAKLNLAAVPTLASNQSYLFSDGTEGAPSISFSTDTDLGIYRYGANQLGISGKVFAINSTADNAWYVGQGASNNVAVAWTYNATPGSASATLGTFGKSNDLTIQGKALNFDSSSLAFALQIVASGRIRAGGGSDDGLYAFQVNGAIASDEYVANPTTLTYAGTTNIDFAAATCQTLTLTGNVTFTTSNLLAGRAKKIRIIASGGPWTITIPAWKNLNASVPASIASGKTADLTLFSWSTTDANISASYAVTS